jgi:DNA-binding response OmpR family regulator
MWSAKQGWRRRLTSTGMRWTMPVIMITNPGDESTRVRALENIAESFFTKPRDFGVLNDYLEQQIAVREVGL